MGLETRIDVVPEGANVLRVSVGEATPGGYALTLISDDDTGTRVFVDSLLVMVHPWPNQGSVIVTDGDADVQRVLREQEITPEKIHAIVQRAAAAWGATFEDLCA